MNSNVLEFWQAIEALTLPELQTFCPAFGADIFDYIAYDTILNKGIKSEML